MCLLSPWSRERLQDLWNKKKNFITSISVTEVVCTADTFPVDCFDRYLHRQEVKELAKLNIKKNHLYQLYLSPKLPGYWLQQPVFLKIYFLFPLQCFSWRCYSFAFLLTDRSINSKAVIEFKEITVFKTKNRSFIIFPMYNQPDSKGIRSFEYLNMAEVATIVFLSHQCYKHLQFHIFNSDPALKDKAIFQ